MQVLELVTEMERLATALDTDQPVQVEEMEAVIDGVAACPPDELRAHGERVASAWDLFQAAVASHRDRVALAMRQIAEQRRQTRRFAGLRPSTRGQRVRRKI